MEVDPLVGPRTLNEPQYTRATMIDPERPEEVGPALLALLREKRELPALDFVESPARLFGGNQTFVHSFRLDGGEPPWDGPLVLRILRAHRVADEVVFESAVQNALAPLAPRVLLHDVNPTLLGGAFQIMQRVPGSALLLGEIGQDVRGLGILRPLLGGFRDAVFGPWPQLLAATHARLHALSPEPVLRALDAAGLRPRLRLGRRVDRVETGVEELALKGMRPVVAWLREREPHLPGRRRLCHGDLFPNQVFARDGSVTGVIDWADATLAPGEFDVAQVCAGIETLPLGIPGLDALQQHLVRRFRESYARLRPMDPEALRFGEVLRAAATLVALARYRAGKGPAPVPYDGQGGERKLVAHLGRNGIQARLD